MDLLPKLAFIAAAFFKHLQVVEVSPWVMAKVRLIRQPYHEALGFVPHQCICHDAALLSYDYNVLPGDCSASDDPRQVS